MPLKKVAGVPPPCLHPEHGPPGHMVYRDGAYEWTCPGCGHVTRFTVRNVLC